MGTSSVAGSAAVGDGLGGDGLGGDGLGADGLSAAHDVEMALLDAALAVRPVREKVGLTIRAAHRDAAEAIACRRRYDLHAIELSAADVGEDGLLWIELRPVELR